MKKIKAIEIVRKIRDRQFAAVKDASHAEIIKYFHDRAAWIKEGKRALRSNSGKVRA